MVKRHPELKTIGPKRLKLVKKVIEEAITFSTRDLLSPEETRAAIKRRVPDSGRPSAALRAYRGRAELTQRELATKSGIPQPHIAAMESGKRTIGLIAAKKLALALGIDYRKLV
ncbi:MAG: helix-turn-helix transcriptional regulator [Deltaproteobacteria bacterium]|nr:helix-turn-helix transcriptional regulator [Deltaproteobacteria bacterium]